MTTKTDPPAGAQAPSAGPHNRRDFLMKAGLGAGVVALVGQAGASLRSLVPHMSYDAPTTVTVPPANMSSTARATRLPTCSRWMSAASPTVKTASPFKRSEP